ncbi:histone-lysine N-methyltransferase SETDB1-like isoform X2 [Daphnia carinata]|uniref:histone-lysine N-methyltransferase SETDB1-like isoform X2 n=1 Tax=Daphnia carinata TaxID=120202 RepID=UPI00257CF34D|nr:histone-lysine N-methyltransferase SETDB1-like isoform X2 [Daphnia carinata]
MEIEKEKENSGKNGVRVKICSACNVKGDNLGLAPYFVRAYFSLDTGKSRRVCKKCFEEAENHQIALVNLLSEHKSIVSGPKRPKNGIEIIDLDAEDVNAESDEEPEECPEEVEITVDVEQFVESVMEKYQFSKQLQDASIHLRDKCAVAKEEFTKLDLSISALENNITALRKELFQPYEPIICYVDSVDIDEEGIVTKHSTTLSSSPASLETVSTYKKIRELPPIGEFIHKPIQALQTVYAMKISLLKPWFKGTVVKIKENKEMPYEICFENAADKPSRTFPPKYLAYAEPSPVQFAVGARVIAQYVGEKYEMMEPLAYYAGIIAEEAKALTQQRYLVFFDQGYAQYCHHEQIMMVCHSSRDVWQDVYSKSRAFVSTYLKGYPERAMVKLQRGQTIKTELNGYWFRGRVDAVDGSLAKIYFPSEKRFEWIYRGSTRFRHLYDLLAKEEARKKQGTTRPTRPTHNMVLVHQKKNAPYVEYTGGPVDDLHKPSSPPLLALQLPSASQENPIRAVARKSTTKVFKSPPVVSAQRRTREPDVDDGCMNRQVNPCNQHIYFEPHQCGTYCVKEYPFVDGENKNVNPFSIPMRWGWARELAKQRQGESSLIVFYRAPCGRRVRNLEEVHRYLRITGSELGIDLFCFDSLVQCFKEFKPNIIYCQIKDISYGKENVRISCVNSIDRQSPLYVDYCTERIPRKGVTMNLDPSFLICCDCTDDCQDKEKCQCWQLTINATARGPGGKINPNAGYEYRRLTQNLVTGVYECNSRCRCQKTCLNRVAQRPLHLRLQLFRTVKCGWGELLTDQDANDDGTQFGDEYLADLNFIELIENQKDGYESECYQSDQQSSESQSSTSDDDWDESSDASGSKNYPGGKRGGRRGRPSKMSKLLSRTPVKPIDVADDGQEDGQKNFTRTLYGPMEKCFVIDARNIGNIGRYFNHSCEPNIFVQNIFVDTQDLRFPWVGFFAQEFIRAGTELTWDYGYQIDSVPGKKLFCYCGAKNCRRRLL